MRHAGTRHEGNGAGQAPAPYLPTPGIFALAARGTLGAVETVGPAAPPMRARLERPEFAGDRLTHAARRFLRDLTPEKIVQIFDAAPTRIADQIQLAHELEEADDHLRGTLRLRRAAVLRLDVRVESGSPGDARADAAAAALSDLVARPWFRQASAHLLRATFLQWSAVELLWEQAGGVWQPHTIRPVEPGRFHFTLPRDPGTPGALVLRKKLWSGGDYVTPAAGKYMIHAVDATAVPGEFAIIRCVAKLAYLRSLDWVNWGAMVDQWGVPVIEWTYPAGASTEKIEDIANDMLALAGRRLVAHEQGTGVTMHDVPEQTPHLEFDERVTRAMSRLLLGQDSSQQAIAGQKTGATLQGEVRDDIRDDDALALDVSQNETFVAPWCAWNFGPDVPPPRIVRIVRETKDPEQRGRIFLQARALGLPVKAEQVYDELGIERPAAGDALLGDGAPEGPQTRSGAAGEQGTGIREQGTGETKREPLSGIQITSAIDVLGKVTDETLSQESAAQLLIALGFEEAVARRMVGAQKVRTRDVSVDDLNFKREMVKLWIADGTIGDVIYNATDIETLLRQVNVPTETGYEEPWLPVQTPAGEIVTGNPIKDKEGDVVGSEVKPAAGPPGGAAPPAFTLASREQGTGNGEQGTEAAIERLAAATDRYVAAAALQAARGAESIAGVTRVLDEGELAQLAELIHLATFASYLAAREQAAAQLADRMQSGPTEKTRRPRRAATSDKWQVTSSDAHPDSGMGHPPLSPVTCHLSPFTVVLAAGEEDEIGVVRAQLEEAIRSFRSKTEVLTKEEFLSLSRRNRARAFTVARQTEQQILEDLRGAVQRSLEQGKSYREWLDETDAIVKERGWEGLEPWHSRVVYQQNVDMAATVGRYDQSRAAGVQYWRYLPSESDNPRAEHQQYYGRVYRMGDGPMPPLDFGCRCGWEPVFEEELEAEGIAVEDEPPSVPGDQEFQFAPADYWKGTGDK